MDKPFDAHFHLLPRDVYDNASFYNESWGGLEGHMSKMDEAGVGRALVSYPTTDYHVRAGLSETDAARAYNDAVRGIAASSGGRLAWLAHVPLSEVEEMTSLLDRAAEAGASGLTMPTNCGGAYPDEERFRVFFEAVERAGLPVFFHPTTMTPFGHESLRHPLITPVFQYAFDTTICLARVVESGMLKGLPALKLVFASFGGAMPFFAGRFDRTYRMLRSRGIVPEMGGEPAAMLKKVYADTSGTTSPEVLALALEVFGEERLLWGSDFPANRDVAGSIEAVRGLDIPASAKEKILFGNLKGLVG